MMTKGEKKEIFLHIIENWFDDKTGDINPDNCIGFYHQFLDNLEFESRFSPEYSEGFHKFLSATISALSRFDFYYAIEPSDNFKSSISHGQEGFKKLISSASGVNDKDSLEEFSAIVKEMYTISKEGFFI